MDIRNKERGGDIAGKIGEMEGRKKRAEKRGNAERKGIANANGILGGYKKSALFSPPFCRSSFLSFYFPFLLT